MNSGPYTVKKLRTDLVARALREASTYHQKTTISEVDKELGYLMSSEAWSVKRLEKGQRRK